jgi:hypothetical protein
LPLLPRPAASSRGRSHRRTGRDETWQGEKVEFVIITIYILLTYGVYIYVYIYIHIFITMVYGRCIYNIL